MSPPFSPTLKHNPTHGGMYHYKVQIAVSGITKIGALVNLFFNSKKHCLHLSIQAKG